MTTTSMTIGHLTIEPEAIPELWALRGVPQPVKHHPEVDTFVHVVMALDQSRRLSADPTVHWAVLMHDLGKGITPTELLPAHHGHEEAGVPLVDAVCRRLGVPDEWTELALLVCEHHLRCHRATEMSPTGIRRLLKRLDAHAQPLRFGQFLVACEADARGRLGLEDREYPQPSILRRALATSAV